MSEDRTRHTAWQCAVNLIPEADLLHADMEFFGPCPLERASGRDAYFADILQPLAGSFVNPLKQPYIFLSGVYQGRIWAAAAGNITGKFTGRWLGLPVGGSHRVLRFGEFYRLEGGRVAEVRCLYDILGLAAQCGIKALPPFGGRNIIPPGPSRGIGLYSERGGDPAESRITLELVEAMISGCNRLNGSDLASQGIDSYWHDDMVWHGPWGIGTTEGLPSFYQHAQGPSVRSFPDRRGTLPKTCFIAEGNVSAHTGWPGLVGNFSGEPFRGIPPTGEYIEQTIMDFYMRDGVRLSENWVLIDLIGFARQCGVDLTAAWRSETDLEREVRIRCTRD